MSGFTLCFDLMEKIGEEVEKKRKQDNLDYWSNLYNCYYYGDDLKGLVETLRVKTDYLTTIKDVGEEMMEENEEGERYYRNMFDMMASELSVMIDENEEGEDFWAFHPTRRPHASPSFMKGSYWLSMWD